MERVIEVFENKTTYVFNLSSRDRWLDRELINVWKLTYVALVSYTLKDGIDGYP